MLDGYAPCEVVELPLITTAPRRSSSEILRLGVLCNAKWNAAKLLLLTVRQLADHGLTFAKVNYYDKEHFSRDTSSVSIAKIAAENDIVLNAVADCAWSYAACIKDALKLEQVGVPTVTVVTTDFELEAQLQCELLGMPDLGLAVTGNPISNLTAQELSVRAATLASLARRIWFGPHGALETTMFGAGANP